MTLAAYLKNNRPGWTARQLSEHTGVPYTTLYDWWHTKRKLMECIVSGLPAYE